MYTVLNDPRRLEEAYKDLLMDGSTFNYAVGCSVGSDACSINEECIPNAAKSRAGIRQLCHI